MGDYTLARDEDVEASITRVLKEHGEVNSLESLHRLVVEDLRKGTPHVAISPERVRRRAALLESVKIMVEKRRSGKRARRCYLCGGEFEPFETVDVYGKRTLSGKRCRDCGYRIEKRGYLPRRYRFYLG
jgi:DNA-directed RNA polymerase subunit RPC12/RpoP